MEDDGSQLSQKLSFACAARELGWLAALRNTWRKRCVRPGFCALRLF